MPHIRFNDQTYNINTEGVIEAMEKIQEVSTRGGSTVLKITEMVDGQQYTSHLIYTPGTPISFHDWETSL